MANIYLTDEQADVEGYLRAKLALPSDNASLVQSVTATEDGPSSGVQCTRTSGGTALAWITDRLDATVLADAAWTLHLWAKESNAAANAALRCQVILYSTGEGSAHFDNNGGTELGTTMADTALAEASPGAETPADGDRLVVKVLIDDAASSMVTGHEVTFSYNGLNPGGEGHSYLTTADALARTGVMLAADITRIRRTIKDLDASNPTLADAELTEMHAQALEDYSRDRPLSVVASLSGDGSTQSFPLPGPWARNFSRVLSIEHPVDAIPPTLVNPDTYAVAEKVAARQPQRELQFLSPPSSGTDNVRVCLTARHIWDDELNTVPANDRAAVVDLAGSYAAHAAAGKAATTSDSTITADAVDYSGGSGRWLSVARRLRERYDDHMGQGGSVQGAGVTTDWDATTSTPGGFLWHDRRRR